MNYRDALDATRNRPAAFDRERNKTAVLGNPETFVPRKRHAAAYFYPCWCRDQLTEPH